jgi:hypothetical protein
MSGPKPKPRRRRREPVDAAAPPPSDEAQLVAELLDEVRSDTRWRELIAALKQPIPPPPAPPAEPPAVGWPESLRVDLPAPASDPTLAELIEGIGQSIHASVQEVPVLPGRPLIGDAWALFRRQLHADIRLYLDRQTAVNLAIFHTARALVQALDQDAPVNHGPWVALRELIERLRLFHLSADGRFRAAEGRLDHLEERLVRLEGLLETRLRRVEEAAEVLALEVEPLGRLRAEVDELLERQ